MRNDSMISKLSMGLMLLLNNELKFTAWFDFWDLIGMCVVDFYLFIYSD